MSRFQPSRASPINVLPTELTFASTQNFSGPSATHTLTASTASASVAYAALTAEDVHLIDAIIARAPPSATTFLAGFKAYNQVLQERGIETTDEVVYYKVLLKLGVERGRNWGEKWANVKQDLGIQTVEDMGDLMDHSMETSYRNDSPRQRHGRLSVSPRPSSRTFVPILDELDGPSDTSFSQRSFTLEDMSPPRKLHHFTPPPEQSLIGLTTKPTRPSIQERHAALLRNIGKTPMIPPLVNKGKGKDPEDAPARQADSNAWRNIEMDPVADDFRWFSVVRPCWNVWKQGLEWVVATNAQVSAARDEVILRRALYQWKQKMGMRWDLERRSKRVNEIRCLSSVLRSWRARVKERKRQRWASLLRLKMKAVKGRVDARILRYAWEKWLQAHRSELASRHRALAMLTHFFYRWRARQVRLTELDNRAQHVLHLKDRQTLEVALEVWKKRVDLQALERVVARQRGWRLVRNAFSNWKRHTRDSLLSGNFAGRQTLKRALASWRRKRSKIKGLQHRADEHIHRRDTLLVRAALRVWVAHERAELLVRIHRMRVLKSSLNMWSKRLRSLRASESLADRFRHQSSLVLLSQTHDIWMRRLRIHQDVATFADAFYSAKLLSAVVLVWKAKLAHKAKMSRQARIVRRLFLERNAWRKMRAEMVARRREKLVQQFERRKLRTVFHMWVDISRRERYHKLALEVMQSRVRQRILHQALTMWTLRVVNIKVREIAIVEERDERILRLSFGKWRAIRRRHVDGLSLMESFQSVKQEELLRRVFVKWYSTTRASQERHMRLAERERELRLATIAATWEKWQDKFVDKRLKPIENMVVIQGRMNLLFRCFRIWEAKTQTLWAIRFFARSTRSKAWHAWRNAMPRALQAKKARDYDRRRLTGAAFTKWLEKYRAEAAPKATARARYSRLPPALPSSRPAPVQRLIKPTSAFPQPSGSRPPRTSSPDRGSRGVALRKKDEALTGVGATHGVRRASSSRSGDASPTRSQGTGSTSAAAPVPFASRRPRSHHRFTTATSTTVAGLLHKQSYFGGLASPQPSGVFPSVASSSRPPSYPPPPPASSSSGTRHHNSDKGVVGDLLMDQHSPRSRPRSLTSSLSAAGLLYANLKERERLKKLGDRDRSKERRPGA